MSQFDILRFIRFWDFKFCHNLRFSVVLEFKFHENFSFWVLSQLEFLSFIFLNVEFLSFVPIWVCLVLSQFEFVLTKKKLWILTWFIFHFHKIAWKLCFCWIFIRLVLDLLQEPAPALYVDCWITTVFWKQGYWIITP